MGLFNQKKDTVEWIEYRPDVLFYKWKNREIKKGSRLVIRAGQKAIFYSGGRIHGIFENEGTYDIDTQIIPFLTHINAALHLRSDTGERAEVYFVNSKDLTLNWGTTQRIMIPTPEVPSGIPVGMNGNKVIYFRDYLAFISKVAGIRDTYSLREVSERIRGEMSGIVAESILNGERAVGLNVLVGLQANNRTLGKKMAEELDKELFDIGLGVRDVNIISVSYPPEVEKMAEKVASQSFVQDVGKYASVSMADSFDSLNGGGNFAAMGAAMAMGQQMAQQMAGAAQSKPAVQQPQPSQEAGTYVCTGCGKHYASPAKFCMECGKPVVREAQNAPQGDRFCPNCRKMVSGKFCPDCGTQTV